MPEGEENRVLRFVVKQMNLSFILAAFSHAHAKKHTTCICTNVLVAIFFAQKQFADVTGSGMHCRQPRTATSNPAAIQMQIRRVFCVRSRGHAIILLNTLCEAADLAGAEQVIQQLGSEEC
jgi:hypothetical protein